MIQQFGMVVQLHSCSMGSAQGRQDWEAAQLPLSGCLPDEVGQGKLGNLWKGCAAKQLAHISWDYSLQKP